jgi:CRISPR-associated protein Cas1
MVNQQSAISNPQSLDLPDCVPARMVNEFAYCPRLAYLEWVQGDFADSADTIEGRTQHRIVDQEKGALPSPAGRGAGGEGEPESIHARSVWLSSPEERLTTRLDLLEGDGNAVTPVDYKHGAVPDLPERAWETDRVQLCAQALVLRAHGYTCTEGVVYYLDSKTRVPVVFDEALVARTRELVQGALQMAHSGQMPPPLVDSPKCPRCSLAGICLPDEVNYLRVTQTEVEGESEDERVRRLMPARDDALPLYVQEQGARISKNSETLEVWQKDRKLGEAKLFETSHVALFGNIQMTTQALAAAIERGIPITFFTMSGWFHGLAHGMMHKNIELRQAQYRAADDPARSLALARAIVISKIRNCRTLVMRNHANPPSLVVEGLAQLAREADRVTSVETLLGVEAMAAKHYFSVFNGLLKGRPAQAAEWAFDFNGRNRRPPRDPINALLSYAYALLAKEFTVTALAVGFDPFLGFYHRPRYGRPSLALDLMEEFRPLVADSVVLAVVNNGVIRAEDFVRRGPAVALTPEARKRFLHAYEGRLEALITHPIFGYRISYRRVLEVQTRLLGRTLTGELAEYPAFTTR